MLLHWSDCRNAFVFIFCFFSQYFYFNLRHVTSAKLSTLTMFNFSYPFLIFISIAWTFITATVWIIFKKRPICLPNQLRLICILNWTLIRIINKFCYEFVNFCPFLFSLFSILEMKWTEVDVSILKTNLSPFLLTSYVNNP